MTVVSALISYFSFKEKGFVFNNHYLYASKWEREHMDKSPYYRQSAITFLLVSVGCFFSVLAIIFDNQYINYFVVIPVIILAVIYAIVAEIING